jgi:hypothetical protein
MPPRHHFSTPAEGPWCGTDKTFNLGDSIMPKPNTNRSMMISVLTALLLAFTGASVLAAAAKASTTPGVLPPNSHSHGKSYAEWSAAWWTWAMELPVDGNPFSDSFSDVTAGQTGKVWFLGAPFGTSERTVTIPHGISLFFGLLNAEFSSLEGFATEDDQRSESAFFVDHIVGLFCTIDGVSVKDLAAYRFVSPQFEFTAPTPWVFGDTGGTGTSVADGYYVMLPPLSKGTHTIHFGGAFHFSVAEGDPFDADFPLDMTYHVTVK